MSMSYWGLLIGLLVILLVTGLYWLVLRMFSVNVNVFSRDPLRNAPPEVRQLAYLQGAYVALVAAALWMVALATASPGWGFGFLGMGMAYLILGLRSKPAQKP